MDKTEPTIHHKFTRITSQTSPKLLSLHSNVQEDSPIWVDWAAVITLMRDSARETFFQFRLKEFFQSSGDGRAVLEKDEDRVKSMSVGNPSVENICYNLMAQAYSQASL